MRGWGVLLVILGVGSFLLPLVGLQFRVLSVFGDSTPIAGAVLAVVGGVMVVAGGQTRK